MTADRKAGQGLGEAFPHLATVANAKGLPSLQSVETVDWQEVDVAFFGLPHGAAQPLAVSMPAHVKMIDLSRQFEAQIRQFGQHSENLLRYIVLSTIDERWKDHLYDLDHLKASIGFRGWGQKDPLIEYKQEAYAMFVDLMTDIRKQVASYLFRAQLTAPPRRPPRGAGGSSAPAASPGSSSGRSTVVMWRS